MATQLIGEYSQLVDNKFIEGFGILGIEKDLNTLVVGPAGFLER